MKMLVAALSLLVLAVASATHTPNHRLTTPEFIQGRTHLYDVTINVTTGVPGLHSQVSKTVTTMELEIYAKTKTDLVIRAQRVMVSPSLSAVGSSTDRVTLTRSSELEEKLKVPIKATYEDGKITSYTLDSKDNLVSSKIKRTILRNLEVYIETPSRKNLMDSPYWSPLTYNTTKSTPFGNYSSLYVVTSSPDAAFPYEKDVFNITRTDNYDTVPYIAYKSHHNFVQQGCPLECTTNQTDNPYGPGCPSQMEPYKTPLKRSFYQKHNIRAVKGVNIHDTIITTETHTADLYDQNMEIVVKSKIQYKRAVSKEIKSSEGQTSYTDLHDWSAEVEEKEIGAKCGYPDPRKAVASATHLINDIASTIIEGKPESPKAKKMGELVIVLQRTLSVLKVGDFRTIHSTIKSYEDLPNASESEKVKRQIWLNILPLIGTDESVNFIVKLITENANKPNPDVSLWEAKSILESLPINIHEPTERTIIELRTLVEIQNAEKTPGYSMFYSATHLAVARVINRLCSTNTGIPDTNEGPNSPRRPRSAHLYRKKCPKTIVKKFITDISESLKSTDDNTKRIIYIQTLAATGQYEVLSTLKSYVYGQISGHSQSYIDYIRHISINSLYSLATSHSKMVQDLLVPVFFNKTEAPKIRSASFGVIVKTQPSLGLLQTIAEESWSEPSEEVGSFVSSTLETFGNSSIPCDQTTSRRIKKVLPQMKRRDTGKHHAQNILKTMFDSVRGFGSESNFQFVPSNESFIPTQVYGTFGAHIDSFKDILFMFATTSQGFNSRNVWDSFLKAINISPAEDIPKNKENDIFEQTEVLPRDPEFWRVVVFEKLFYSYSYYYYDGKESSEKPDFLNVLKEQITRYFKVDRHGDIEGHIVRLYIPSSYHAKSISHAYPSPIEFEMRSPLIVSLKVKAEIEKKSSELSYAIDMTPSVYYSTVYNHHFLNLQDCKHIGVYHEKKIALVYPMKIVLRTEKGFNMSVTYKFPDLPRTVINYHSEAGTYSGSKVWTNLLEEDKKVFKTIPTQFKRSDTFSVPAFPSYTTQVLTEDIQFGHEDIPKNSKEAWSHLIKDFLNAGWRRKSIVVKRIPGSSTWTQDTEVKISFGAGRNYFIPKSKLHGSSENWKTGLNFDDNLKEHDVNAYSEEGQTLSKKFKIFSHIKDDFYLRIEQSSRGKSIVEALFNVSYKHTFGGHMHMLSVNTSCKTHNSPKEFSMSGSYALAFFDEPNEFSYKESSFGKQRGIAIASISFPKLPAFVRPTIVSKALFYYKPLEKVLKNQMSPAPTHEDVLPETHSECLNDVRIGKSQSVACIKAVREAAIFNRFRVHVVWDKDLPYPVKEVIHQVDLALKHAFYNHMHSQKRKSHTHTKEMHAEVYYINKMTDRPVFDVILIKPTEVLKFHKIKAGVVQPLSSIDNMFESHVARYTNNSYPATCGLMGHYIRTYDMKTFKLPKEDMPSCTYILSTHCTTNKKFAILATLDPESHEGTKEIHAYIGSDEFTFVPGTKSVWKVKHNGRDHTVEENSPVMFNKEARIYAYIHTTSDKSSYLEFHAKKAGIKITYDGTNVKTMVHPRYKGELCGLCSEFNGEIVRELRGIDKCLYSDSSDFVKSNIVGSTCSKEYKSQRICNNDDLTYLPRKTENTDNDEEIEPPVLKNIVLTKEKEFCFSVKPWRTCNNGNPVESETEEVGFHCLPKTDKDARKYVKESRSRILGELTLKPVNHKESIEIPSTCRH